MMIVHELIEDVYDGMLTPYETIYLEVDERNRVIDWWKKEDVKVKTDNMLEMDVKDAIDYCLTVAYRAIVDSVLSIPEACERYGCAPSTLRRLCAQGKFGSYARRRGRDWLILVDALDEYFLKNNKKSHLK